MKKQLSFRIHPLLAAVIAVGALFVVLFSLYGINRWLSTGQVIGHVELAEADLGGKTVEEAYATVDELEVGRLSQVVSFTLDGSTVQLRAAATGLDIPEDAIVAEAMAVGRTGNFASQFLWWLTHIFDDYEIELNGSVDPGAMEEIYDTWDTEVIAKPIQPGSIEIVEGELVATYPETGVGILRDAATPIIIESMLDIVPSVADLPTVTVEPILTDADVDEALAEARQLLGGPITLVFEDRQTVFTVEQLKAAFVSETVIASPPRIVNSFDPAVIDEQLETIRSEFESEPVDAEFVIDGLLVSVKPGRNGTRIDEVETAATLARVGLTGPRTGTLPVVEGAEPEVTAEYLDSLNVRHLVSQFTTYHDCCEARVVNIQKMADAIDGTIVVPGQTFSINDHVGERTIEKGYLPAGSIVGGEIVDTVGGGVSQFATTFYNTVFWGGYQDIDHKPHSYYFSRYPEGIEATLFWRSIDLKFRNNREHAVLIDTTYTGTSITVRFFGFNHGRTLSGEQRNGTTRISVLAEGGPEALHVKGNTSERFNPTTPPDPEYRPNPELKPGTQKTLQSEGDGWSVRITRTILIGGTQPFEEQEWVVRYSPQFAIYEVHPCNMPGTSTPCPTTTTAPPPTTTTTTTPTTTPPPTTP